MAKGWSISDTWHGKAAWVVVFFLDVCWGFRFFGCLLLVYLDFARFFFFIEVMFECSGCLFNGFFCIFVVFSCAI